MKIDYKKIDEEYKKIYTRLAELEEKYEIPLVSDPKIEEVGITEKFQVPLEIKCFLALRAMDNPDLQVDFMYDPNHFGYILTYYDKYEFPSRGKRIILSWNDLFSKDRELDSSFFESIHGGHKGTLSGLPLLRKICEQYLLSKGLAYEEQIKAIPPKRKPTFLESAKQWLAWKN